MIKYLKQLVPYLLIIGIVVLIRIFIITPVRVTGTSMVPTLAEKDIMLLYKFKKYFDNEYDRYDIIVIKYEKTRLVKRVIGLPGETIKCENGIMYINGKEISDKFIKGITSDFESVTLKDDEYFVMGDNRLVSKDSREIGPVKKNTIQGTTNIIIFPFKNIKKVN